MTLEETIREAVREGVAEALDQYYRPLFLVGTVADKESVARSHGKEVASPGSACDGCERWTGGPRCAVDLDVSRGIVVYSCASRMCADCHHLSDEHTENGCGHRATRGGFCACPSRGREEVDPDILATLSALENEAKP